MKIVLLRISIVFLLVFQTSTKAQSQQLNFGLEFDVFSGINSADPDWTGFREISQGGFVIPRDLSFFGLVPYVEYKFKKNLFVSASYGNFDVETGFDDVYSNSINPVERGSYYYGKKFDLNFGRISNDKKWQFLTGLSYYNASEEYYYYDPITLTTVSKTLPGSKINSLFLNLGTSFHLYGLNFGLTYTRSFKKIIVKNYTYVGLYDKEITSIKMGSLSYLKFSIGYDIFQRHLFKKTTIEVNKKKSILSKWKWNIGISITGHKHSIKLPFDSFSDYENADQSNVQYRSFTLQAKSSPMFNFFLRYQLNQKWGLNVKIGFSKLVYFGKGERYVQSGFYGVPNAVENWEAFDDEVRPIYFFQSFGDGFTWNQFNLDLNYFIWEKKLSLMVFGGFGLNRIAGNYSIGNYTLGGHPWKITSGLNSVRIGLDLMFNRYHLKGFYEKYLGMKDVKYNSIGLTFAVDIVRLKNIQNSLIK